MDVPQPVADFAGLLSEQASTGATFPLQRFKAWLHSQPVPDNATLQAQSAAERQRLGPVASALADMVGYNLSLPAQLNRIPIPIVNGAAAGAVQEGVKSALEGDSWKTAGENAVKGGLYGAGGSAVSKLVNPTTASALTEMIPTWLTTHGIHALTGDSEIGTQVVGGQMINRMIKPAADWAKENSGRVLTPLQPVISRVLQGAGSAYQQEPGMWNQWLTGS